MSVDDLRHDKFCRWTGAALALAGLLTFLINVGLTPLLPPGAPYAETAASTVFLWRQSASSLVAVLLLFGSTGLYFRQTEQAGRFGVIAFILAFVGSALLLATEWGEVFLVRELALRAPNAVQALDAPPHPNLYDFGAIISFSFFTVGWLALAISTFRVRILSRFAAGLVIAGFFLIPLLGALGIWGAVLGNAVLGFGLFWLSRDLIARKNPNQALEPTADRR
jgi:hypothetical protein